jgi:hypothetical protein
MVHWLVPTDVCRPRPIAARATFTIVVSSAGASEPRTSIQVSLRNAGMICPVGVPGAMIASRFSSA